MSQRQLAQQSGVDHSTISRLIRGDRMPSLGTATKLARGLRELRDDADTPQYLGLVASGATNPTARVEYALRADELLSEPQVRQIMEYYLAVRMRRFGRTFQPSEPSPSRPPERPIARSAPLGGPGGRRSRHHVADEPAWLGQSADRPVARPARPTLGSRGPSPAGDAGRTTSFSRARPGRPPRPGLGDSERRRLGRRRSLIEWRIPGCRAWNDADGVAGCAARSRTLGCARSAAPRRLASAAHRATNAVAMDSPGAPCRIRANDRSAARPAPCQPRPSATNAVAGLRARRRAPAGRAGVAARRARRSRSSGRGRPRSG